MIPWQVPRIFVQVPGHQILRSSQWLERILQGRNLWSTGEGLEIPRENVLLGGGFKYCLLSPLLGEDSHFD